MNESNSSRTRTLTLFIIYFAALTAILLIVSQLFYQFELEDLLRENELVEWLEFSWLCITSLFLFLASRKTVKFKKLYSAMWLLPLVGGARELDGVMDEILFHGSWKISAVILTAVIIYKVSKSFDALKLESVVFIQTQQMVFLGIGFFILVVFARLCGQQEMWQVIMEERYTRNIGRYLEEMLEFLGYIILMTGSLDCLLRD